MEEAKEIQSFRRKPGGIRSALNLNTYILLILSLCSAIGLAFGQKFSEEEKLAVSGIYIHYEIFIIIIIIIIIITNIIIIIIIIL